jgi:uncharacterized membrane protein
MAVPYPQKLAKSHKKVLGRILAFSDGVFAFAITLLILDVRVPADTLKEDLGHVLVSLWPNYLAFLLSFFVIGLLWVAHIRLFREIIRYDQNLIGLNLLFLLFIVVIPFSTSVLSMHLIQISVIVYAALMACAGYMLAAMRFYAGHNYRLIGKKYKLSHIKRGILFSLFMPIGFTVSVGIAFLSPLAAQFLWIAILIVHFTILRLMKPQKL